MSIFVKDETNIRTTPLYVMVKDEELNQLICSSGIPLSGFDSSKFIVAGPDSFGNIYCFLNSEVYSNIYYIYSLRKKYWIQKDFGFSLNFAGSNAVMLNDEVHILGGGWHSTLHLKYSNGEWTEVDALPYPITEGGSAVILNDEIHILGGQGYGKKHYKYSNGKWIEVSTLPYEFVDGSAVVCDDIIYILGGTGCDDHKNIHKYLNGSWIKIIGESSGFGSTPNISRSLAVVLNYKIYILGSKEKYYYRNFHSYDISTNTWKRLSNIPYDFNYGVGIVISHDMDPFGPEGDNIYTFGPDGKCSRCRIIDNALESSQTWDEYPDGLPIYTRCLFTLNDEVHIFGGDSTPPFKHYKYLNNEWVYDSNLDIDRNFIMMIILNNEFHILGAYTNDYIGHYKYSNGEWIKVSTLPYNFSRGYAVVLNNEIHILGGDGNPTGHYKYSNGSWVEVSTLPYGFYDGKAVVLNNEIHILGNYSSSGNSSKHYKYSNGSWVEASTLPYDSMNISGIEILNGEIHIIYINIIGNDRLSEHYKYSNSEWIKLGDLMAYVGATSPNIRGYVNSLHVMNNILYSYEKHSLLRIRETTTKKLYDPSDVSYSWIQEELLPMETPDIQQNEVRSIVSLDNHMYLIGNNEYRKTKIYKYLNGSWSLIDTINHDFDHGGVVALNDGIHIFGEVDGDSEYIRHYIYSDGNVTEDTAIISSNTFDNKGLFIGLGDEIHAFNGFEHFKCSMTPIGPFTIELINDAKLINVLYNSIVQVPNDDNPSVIEQGHELLAIDICSEMTGFIERKIYLNTDVTTQRYNQLIVEYPDLISDPYNNQNTEYIVYENDDILIKIKYGIIFVPWGDEEIMATSAIITSNGKTEKASKYTIVYGDGTKKLEIVHPYNYEYIWTSIGFLYGFAIDNSSSVVVLGDELHALGGNGNPKSHRKYINGEWISVSTLPYNFEEGSATVLNNEIHIFGGSSNYTKHYKYSNGEWIEVSTLPFQAWHAFSVTIGKTVHLLGGFIGGYSHYKYDISNLFAHVFNKIKNIWVKVTSMDKSSIDNYQITEHTKKVKAIWVKDSNNKAKRVYY